jgi:effector-binding domain-containing protein
MAIKINSLLIVVSLAFASCNDPEVAIAREKEKQDSAKALVIADNNKFKQYDNYVDKPGIVGIYQVSEMLTLCRKDSAPADKMPEAFARTYEHLESDMQYLGIKAEGAAGSIYYNNDPENFVFECVYPIAEVPKKKPKNSQVVMLEASNMLIFNFYGDYRYLYRGYDKIKKHISENHLLQSGPLREFYITDPRKQKDTSRWLTRIMVPVTTKDQIKKPNS